MTRKHFKALAEGIKNLSDNPSKKEIARMVARVVMQFNPRFDGVRFMEACQVDTD